MGYSAGNVLCNNVITMGLSKKQERERQKKMSERKLDGDPKSNRYQAMKKLLWLKQQEKILDKKVYVNKAEKATITIYGEGIGYNTIPASEEFNKILNRDDKV